MGQQKGGKKLRRSPKHASYYTHVQPIRTARNRTQRAIKRARRKAFWQEQGVKKNGEPVARPEHPVMNKDMQPA
jgi:hypothetical protein